MTNSQADKQFIFVGGAPRSGTTLLQNMLDSHPDIFGGPEFIHLPDIITLQQKLNGSVSRRWIDLFCDQDDVNSAIRELIEGLLLPIAKDHSGCYLSEKTPGNVLVFSQLLELFPGARFIFLVRDPRAVVSSMLKVGQRAEDKGIKTAVFTENVHQATKYTAKCLEAGFRAVAADPTRVSVMTYENLVTDPEAESRRLCRFLDLEWTSQMLYPEKFDHLGQRAITKHSDKIWYEAQNYNRNPDSKSLYKWQSQLSLWQQVFVTRAFAHNAELRKLGYALDLDHVGPIPYYGALLQQHTQHWRQRIERKLRR